MAITNCISVMCRYCILFRTLKLQSFHFLSHAALSSRFIILINPSYRQNIIKPHLYLSGCLQESQNPSSFEKSLMPTQSVASITVLGIAHLSQECEPACSSHCPSDIVVVVDLAVSPYLESLTLHNFGYPLVPVVRYRIPLAVSGTYRG